MKSLNSSLTASVFSLGKGGDSATEALLPSDALVIVIKERSEAMGALQLPQWQNCQRWDCESLPLMRRKAGRAYSEQLQTGSSTINVSG